MAKQPMRKSNKVNPHKEWVDGYVHWITDDVNVTACCGEDANVRRVALSKSKVTCPGIKEKL